MRNILLKLSPLEGLKLSIFTVCSEEQFSNILSIFVTAELPNFGKSNDVKFDIIGGGFEIVSHLTSGVHSGYGLYCSGYSDNSKAPGFVNDAITDDKEGYDKLQKEKLVIAKELKPLADRFDKDIEAVFIKHGFRKI